MGLAPPPTTGSAHHTCKLFTNYCPISRRSAPSPCGWAPTKMRSHFRGNRRRVGAGFACFPTDEKQTTRVERPFMPNNKKTTEMPNDHRTTPSPAGRSPQRGRAGEGVASAIQPPKLRPSPQTMRQLAPQSPSVLAAEPGANNPRRDHKTPPRNVFQKNHKKLATTAAPGITYPLAKAWLWKIHFQQLKVHTA